MTRKKSFPAPSSQPAGRWSKRFVLIAACAAVVTVVGAIRHYWSAEPANAQMPGVGYQRGAGQSNSTRQPAQRPSQPAPAARSNSAQPDMVARVNGEVITRHDLGRECLRHYGEEVLDSYVNKRVIAMECAAQGVQITRQDVEAEIDRMAKHFNLSVQQWYKMLQEERGINPEQYAADIVWPTLALRRLAADRLQVSEAELRAAYETQFGPAVKARLIACKEAAKARQLHAQVAAKPDDFGRVAKKESDDAPSASDMGWIPPIRRHGGPKEIEQAAFALRDGEISPVIPVSGQYVILKREKGLEARDVPFDQVAPQLKQMLEERKVRGVAGEVFRELKKKAHCEIHFGDPRYANSGIAAVINGEKITMGQLQDACIERHGKEVLEGTINRRLIEQACKKSKVVVTKEELAEEVRRAAEVSVPPKADGTPDVESWIKLVTEKQGVSYEVYMHDSVWPSVALRKLAGDQGAVTEEDIRRGFEANYGPRVRCLAAVFSDLRLTQRIWKMAREKHQTLAEAREKQVASGITAQQADGLFFDTFNDFFGDLAEQYSIEPGSRKLRGQVPPIKKWGGQPILEKEAFALSPGELSGIIQVGDKFVVLFCQGLTDPVNVDPASVRELILEDLREKKLHAAMATYFQRLQDFATIDNYLAGTSQSPQEKLRGGATLPDLQQVPTRQ